MVWIGVEWKSARRWNRGEDHAAAPLGDDGVEARGVA
jgi:hypothetical protein